ncbi:lipopolysaccharide cholinephosphotransferase [Pseudobutyrivibrio sp. YE44]|uniref:LicD family protein n=1 Tax=Pseudobutyrivibrio sp. YE44 TaxID=1520802 RepID=UPI0008882A3B|nr:LicD family protein [Pseudobutyrivibrio sp. YE44]SDB46885.1 lipopolysaccharide cholinephosphotransferase [Pseudobutyrivibrio sp. YE44]
MRKLEDINELHNIQLEMMEQFDKLCKEEGLTYFLAGGTLLGAIRHKGFIPWDDDVDLSMPRPDYEKLMSLGKNHPEKFGFLSLTQIGDGTNYPLPFAKIENTKTVIKKGDKSQGGLFIDIFPIDGYGDNKDNAKMLIRKACDSGCRIGRTFLPWSELKFKTALCKVLYILKGREKMYKDLIMNLQKNDFYKSEYIGSTFGLRCEKEIIERWTFETTIELPFEGKMFMAPKGYDQYLTQMYGNYMELPPVEKRVAPHEFDVYVK